MPCQQCQQCKQCQECQQCQLCKQFIARCYLHPWWYFLSFMRKQLDLQVVSKVPKSDNSHWQICCKGSRLGLLFTKLAEHEVLYLYWFEQCLTISFVRLRFWRFAKFGVLWSFIRCCLWRLLASPQQQNRRLSWHQIGDNCAHLSSTKESLILEYDIWWYWVSRRRCWLVLGDIGSVWGAIGWYLVVLGQYRVVLIDIRWYWVSTGQCWSVLGGTGSVEGGTDSVEGGTGWYMIVLGQ